jgi:hypothetical protein
MKSHAVWHNDEKTILRQVYLEGATLQDFYEVVDESYEMATSVDHTVHIIIDVTQTSRIPGNIISGMRYAANKIPPNRGLVVSVGLGTFMDMILGVTKKIYPTLAQNSYAVKTFEEAEKIIKQHQLA